MNGLKYYKKIFMVPSMEQIFLVKPYVGYSTYILSFSSEQSYEAGDSKPMTLMRKLRLRGDKQIN